MSETPVSYGAFVRSLFQRSGDPSKDFTHAVLGIVTEIHEYLSAQDDTNGLEELGDLRFYEEALRQVIEDHVGPPAYPVNAVLDGEGWDGLSAMFLSADIEGPASVTSAYTNSLLDDAKRWVGYGKQPASLYEVLDTVTHLVEFVNRTGPYPCEDSEHIEATNRAKLDKRYQGLFTQDKALNRDTQAERAAIQAA